MKWLPWSYLKRVLLALIQGTLFTIFMHPWQQLAAAHWGFSAADGSLWVLIISVGSIWVIIKGSKREGSLLPPAGFGFLISFTLALIWKLPLFWWLPLMPAILYSSVRFSEYAQSKSFAFDWGVSNFLLLIAALFEGSLGYSLGAGPIALYFLVGIAGVVLWNAEHLEKRGLRPNYRGLGRFILLFVGAVALLSLALGFILSPELIRQALVLLQKGYDLLADVLLFLFVRPFAWLMSPLFRWAEQQELSFVPLELEGMAEDAFLNEHELSLKTADVSANVGKFLFLGVLAVVLFLVARRLLKVMDRVGKQVETEEERESVFSGQEVLDDLKGAWRRLVRPFTRLGRFRWYKGDDPLLIIRDFYAKFALRSRRRVPFPPGATPSEYGRDYTLWAGEESRPALEVLTDAYNDARYGEKASPEAVESAAEAFNRLRS